MKIKPAIGRGEADGDRRGLRLRGRGASQIRECLVAISESQVKAPSEMFDVGDAWIVPAVSSWQRVQFHVLRWAHVFGKRSDFTNRTNSWQNWNKDHQAHTETWYW